MFSYFQFTEFVLKSLILLKLGLGVCGYPDYFSTFKIRYFICRSPVILYWLADCNFTFSSLAPVLGWCYTLPLISTYFFFPAVLSISLWRAQEFSGCSSFRWKLCVQQHGCLLLFRFMWLHVFASCMINSYCGG